MAQWPTGASVLKLSGGGVGLPSDRPAELVALDVKNQMVSVEAARKIYGVTVDPVSFAVDETQTQRLRSQPQVEWDVAINEEKLTVEIVPARAG
jgi:hypothetical protein